MSVACARANGQVERLNKSVGDTLVTVADERRWDESVRDVQFAINNTVNRSIQKTPSQLLLGYTPRGGEDMILRDEVQQLSRVLGDVVQTRLEAAEAIGRAQMQQKQQYDRRRKEAHSYEVGEQVLMERAPVQTGESRKMQERFRGPLEVIAKYDNDRYRVREVAQRRTRRALYEATVAADRLKPWILPGGVSDEEPEEGAEELPSTSSPSSASQ